MTYVCRDNSELKHKTYEKKKKNKKYDKVYSIGKKNIIIIINIKVMLIIIFIGFMFWFWIL